MMMTIRFPRSAASFCRKRIAIGLFAGLCVFVSQRAEAAASIALVDDGAPQAAVILPAQPEEREQQAADELVEYMKRISGAELPVAVGDEAPKGLLPIRLGGAADAALDERIRERGDSYSSFALTVDESGVSVRGLHPEGTLFGVYELLEQLGVRWFMPGEFGTVVPTSTSVSVDVQNTVQVPSMDYRKLQWAGGVWRGSGHRNWNLHLRMGGDARPTGSHGLPGDPPRGTGRQACLSGHHAPGALEDVVAAMRATLQDDPDRTYFGMGPLDGGGYCQCEGCRALDGDSYDPLRDAPSMTDRYIWFFNQVLEELAPEYPDIRIVWYVYAAHMFPPEHHVPNPRIVPVFAPITLDRTRSMTNPMSPDRHILQDIVRGWSEHDLREMYFRGYYNNLACPQFPFSQVDRIRNEIPALHEQGVNVMRVEVIFQSFASTPLTPYLASRVWWDVDADVDALLADFYDKFFGPAREPMSRYFADLEAAFRDTPYFTGCSYLYFPIFDDQRRDTLRAHLEHAATRVGQDGETDSRYAQRVQMIRQGFERLELFLDMMAARNRHDYVAAHELMSKYVALTDSMVEKGWMHSHEKGGGGYFGRFFRRKIVDGYRRAVEEGTVVKGLPDEWDFLIDPTGLGEIAGWQRGGELGGNWQPLKTSSRSWSDQGLHYYKGAAWYRTRVQIPEKFAGRPIYLWFGGVDEAAKVWVNGVLLGTNREPLHGLPGVAGTFRPFDLLATDAVRFGKQNTVSVKITNTRLNELGTGGIVAPVMFWSPKDPDWTP